MMGRGGIVSIGLRVDSMEMEKSGCALVRTSCGEGEKNQKKKKKKKDQSLLKPIT
jgi:hypothetical protein